MSVSPDELIDFSVQIARRAGRYLMSQLPLGKWHKGGIEHKAGRELVTDVDRTSEQLLVRAVRERYPDHAILAEEGGADLGANGEADYRWIIDPLDGTTNFLHGHPLFAVSIAVERLPGPAAMAVDAIGPEHHESTAAGADEPDEALPAVRQPPLGQPESELVTGVIYLPYLDETYGASRGGGAFLNSRSIRLAVSSTEELSDALVASGFAYDRERYRNYDNFLRLAQQARGIRRCGAAAIDMAFVAAGRYDAYWELGTQRHDLAAGALMVLEAGGQITDFRGGSGWLDGHNVVASNGRLHEAVRAELDEFSPGG